MGTMGILHVQCELGLCKNAGGGFLPNFQESLFLAWIYTMGTNFVPNV